MSRGEGSGGHAMPDLTCFALASPPGVQILPYLARPKSSGHNMLPASCRHTLHGYWFNVVLKVY
jgi:hypothetical protein